MRLFVLCLMLFSFAMAAAAEEVTMCGLFYQGGSCLYFERFAPGGWLEVDSLAAGVEIEVNVPVQILTTIRPDSDCAFAESTIVVHEVGHCEMLDLGCGVIEEYWTGDGCFLWTSEKHGSVLVTGRFSVGDSLQVEAYPSYDCATQCIAPLPNGIECFWDSRFSACVDTLTPVKRLSWGELKRQWAERGSSPPAVLPGPRWWPFGAKF